MSFLSVEETLSIKSTQRYFHVYLALLQMDTRTNGAVRYFRMTLYQVCPTRLLIRKQHIALLKAITLIKASSCLV